jgi:hypothetical protein
MMPERLGSPTGENSVVPVDSTAQANKIPSLPEGACQRQQQMVEHINEEQRSVAVS